MTCRQHAHNKTRKKEIMGGNEYIMTSKKEKTKTMAASKTLSRDDLINITTNAIQTIQNKALKGRLKDHQKEKIRIQYWKTLNGFIRTSANLMLDKEIEILYDELDKLKLATTNINNDSIEDVENNIDAINEINKRIKELKKNKD